MKLKTWLYLFMIVALALGSTALISSQALAQAPNPDGPYSPQAAVGTAFTYQGRLTDSGGTAVAGPCDFQFSLWTATSGGSQIGSTQTVASQTLANGHFSARLDFGSSAFHGDERHLQIAVRCPAGSGSYTTLTGRVAITVAPYALHALSTDNAWSLTGNSGATPGTNFLGTTDNQALQFHVNGIRALRLEPGASSPNIIGGYNGNSVSAGVAGATIGGGGMSGKPNVVTDTFGVIGGGIGNIVGSYAATISGGQENAATGSRATVGGGYKNTAGNEVATVGGGQGNAANDFATTVSGGNGNTATGYYATIAGGVSNSADFGEATTVSGGRDNTASGHYATVPGGKEATANQYGQWAYAGGGFSSITGTAQTSVYVMRKTSVGAAWTDLSLDGYSQLLGLSDGRTLTFDILLAARSDAGESAGYYIWGVAENVGGTTTVWATTMMLHEDDGNWDAQAMADDTNNVLAIQVMGNGEAIRWVATVRTAEVAW